MRAWLLWLALALTGGVGAATDPAANGAFTAGMQTVSIAATQGATLATDVHFPQSQPSVVDPAAGKCPVLVLGHGFFQGKANHVNHGKHLASRGYVVLIPNFAGGSDHSRNADDLSKLIDWAVAQNSDPASLFFGRLRLNRIGATGHSAGGLSAILATSRDRRIRALAPMDPVDNAGLGVAALAAVKVPVAITHSEPQSCNASGSGAVLYAAARAPRRGIKIVGANHSDAQDPTSITGVIACGSAVAARQTLYRRYVAGWFEFHLRGDASYRPYVFNVGAGPLAADLAAGRITFEEGPAPYRAWQAVNFGPDDENPAIAGDAADPDDDGIPNLLEYAQNTDPLAPSPGPAAEVVPLGGLSYLALSFSRAESAEGVALTVQAGEDLQAWTDGSVYSTTGSVPNTAVTTEVSRTAVDGIETIRVRDNAAIGMGARRFLRLCGVRE